MSKVKSVCLILKKYGVFVFKKYFRQLCTHTMDIAKIYEFKMLNMTMKILFIDLSLALHVLTEKMVSTFFTGHAFKFQQ